MNDANIYITRDSTSCNNRYLGKNYYNPWGLLDNVSFGKINKINKDREPSITSFSVLQMLALKLNNKKMSKKKMSNEKNNLKQNIYSYSSKHVFVSSLIRTWCTATILYGIEKTDVIKGIINNIETDKLSDIESLINTKTTFERINDPTTINYFKSKDKLNLYITPYLKEELYKFGWKEFKKGNMHKSLYHGVIKYVKFLNYLLGDEFSNLLNKLHQELYLGVIKYENYLKKSKKRFGVLDEKRFGVLEIKIRILKNKLSLKYDRNEIIGENEIIDFSLKIKNLNDELEYLQYESMKVNRIYEELSEIDNLIEIVENLRMPSLKDSSNSKTMNSYIGNILPNQIDIYLLEGEDKNNVDYFKFNNNKKCISIIKKEIKDKYNNTYNFNYEIANVDNFCKMKQPLIFSSDHQKDPLHINERIPHYGKNDTNIEEAITYIKNAINKYNSNIDDENEKIDENNIHIVSHSNAMVTYLKRKNNIEIEIENGIHLYNCGTLIIPKKQGTLITPDFCDGFKKIDEIPKSNRERRKDGLCGLEGRIVESEVCTSQKAPRSNKSVQAMPQRAPPDIIDHIKGGKRKTIKKSNKKNTKKKKKKYKKYKSLKKNKNKTKNI